MPFSSVLMSPSSCGLELHAGLPKPVHSGFNIVDREVQTRVRRWLVGVLLIDQNRVSVGRPER